MRKIWIGLVCAIAALLLCGAASANVTFGVTTVGTMAGDGVTGLDALTSVGMTDDRIVISWDAAAPTTIPNQAELDWQVPQAAVLGVRVIFAVSPLRPRDLTTSRTAPAQFAAFLQNLARTYPGVTDFVVGNEPNQPRFWQPQFTTTGLSLSGGAYEKVLARGYDALKAVNPAINVIGVGLSPRGNDNPRAKENVSTSPIRFLHDLAAAYRASKRKAPIMDELGFHPYPNQNSDSPAVGYPWPRAGFPNLDRIKQAVWDGFSGTGQPVFAERGARAPAHQLKLELEETGWQVRIPTSLVPRYHGVETVNRLLDEQTQAQYYADLVRLVSCDPNVRSFSFFQLVDESDLDRWQAGLMRIDGSHRLSYDSVKAAIAQTRGRCAIPPVGWKHTTVVAGALAFFAGAPKRASNTRWGLSVRAQEGATFKAGVFKIGTSKLTSGARAAITRSLLRGSVTGLAMRGVVNANSRQSFRLPAKRAGAGWFVYAVRVAASMNPRRANVIFGRPFHIAGPTVRP